MNPYIGTRKWASKSHGRFGVVNQNFCFGGEMYPDFTAPWTAMDDRGGVLQLADGMPAHFDTHAEAIHFAQREALKTVAAHFTLPPETLEPTC